MNKLSAYGEEVNIKNYYATKKISNNVQLIQMTIACLLAMLVSISYHRRYLMQISSALK